MKNFGKNALLLFGSLLVAGLLVEIILRVGGVSYLLYQYDTCRGYALRPGYAGWFRNEGEAYIRINKNGLRDREHSLAKPADTLRIAVLGDSYVEALQVPLEETFWAVLERELSRCSYKKVEAFNFGVGGYGTAQELLTLKYFVWQYHPDLVILAFLTGNDILDNVRTRQFFEESLRFHDGGKDELSRESIKFRIIDSLKKCREFLYTHLRIVQLFYRVKTVIIPQLTAPREKTKHFLAEQGLWNEIYQPPESGAWQEAWALTERLLALMRDEVRQRGADFLVVTLSNSPQVYPDKRVRQEFMHILGVEDLFYPDRRVKKWGEEAGVEVLNLAPQLQAYAEERQVFLHGFANSKMPDKFPGRGHWNRAGHLLAGKIIARHLCDRLPTPKPETTATITQR